MTAPGNSALLFILTAVFVACAGYAAGRLHQRFRMEQDREDAYRDGYDMATRSVFSTAARLIAPRRSARAAVAVRPVLDGAVVADRPSLSPATQAPTAFPASPASPRLSAAENDAGSLGFPVPPRPPEGIVGEPVAVGGVVYRPFPDPRFVGSSELLPADRGSPQVRPGVPLAESVPAETVPWETVPGETGTEPASSGRHTVPDELVQAATYRLPPDRVFRARVPDAGNASAPPEEPTTRISLPKPRQS